MDLPQYAPHELEVVLQGDGAEKRNGQDVGRPGLQDASGRKPPPSQASTAPARSAERDAPHPQEVTQRY